MRKESVCVFFLFSNAALNIPRTWASVSVVRSSSATSVRNVKAGSRASPGGPASSKTARARGNSFSWHSSFPGCCLAGGGLFSRLNSFIRDGAAPSGGLVSGLPS